MGQAGGVILKVNFDAEEVYFKFEKQYLDMLYKINDHRYIITPDVCYRTPLSHIDSDPSILDLTCPEVRFVRSVRDFYYKQYIEYDEETAADSEDVDDNLDFKRLQYSPHAINSRIVISL